MPKNTVNRSRPRAPSEVNTHRRANDPAYEDKTNTFKKIYKVIVSKGKIVTSDDLDMQILIELIDALPSADKEELLVAVINYEISVKANSLSSEQERELAMFNRMSNVHMKFWLTKLVAITVIVWLFCMGTLLFVDIIDLIHGEKLDVVDDIFEYFKNNSR